jgi:hypothetical protein
MSKSINIEKFSRMAKRRYHADIRYSLESLSNGFATRENCESQDTELLTRICAAYQSATTLQADAPAQHQATEWWEKVRHNHLGPVTSALANCDVQALDRMYRNFYRDPCGAGVTGLPGSIAEKYFGTEINDFDGAFYLGDALHRFDYWLNRVGNGFTAQDLRGPNIGNPFGIVLDTTLIRVGSEFEHYCAHEIATTLTKNPTTVMEIGGGFGGMAYYLMREQRGLKYINFDVPESIALASYYLMKSLPNLKFLLCGEEDLCVESMGQVDIVMMPISQISKVPDCSADLVFSSHVFSDLSNSSLDAYLAIINRVTTNYFWYIGRGKMNSTLVEHIQRSYPELALIDARESEWNSRRVIHPNEVEFLYQKR